VWKHAPIKTTLLRELEDLNDVTYLEFEHVDDLRARGARVLQHQAAGDAGAGCLTGSFTRRTALVLICLPRFLSNFCLILSVRAGAIWMRSNPTK